jgi:hypothetical protein
VYQRDSSSDAKNIESESGFQLASQHTYHNRTSISQCNPVCPVFYGPLIPYVTPNNPRVSAPTAQFSFAFPISLDHLLTLVQYNVLRAILANMNLLQLMSETPTECGNFIYVEPFAGPQVIPESLAPTSLQLSTPHKYWIDIIPHGQWRDNMIIAEGTYDEDEMCTDVVGGLWEGFADCDRRGLVVWNDPWDFRGWEVSEGFLKKWGWLLKGCGEVLEATNHWRAIRGDDALVMEE